ncbi:DUF4390 domain-containing protein [Desulfogranum mediterraneum]|uniref:DUF4390 domain-containing protein n=1 Tax=Desulfogranum mediterraneum TaxID=160661 RepID=UPI0003FB4D7E|nr:DUF4390 domain-containing protein [Desulfogranum mediterraneum]
MKALLRPLLLILFALLLLAPGSNGAVKERSPELKDIIVTTSNSELLLFATVANCFTPEMITGVQNGIPISFVFQVELSRERSSWFDATLVETVITHTMTYDSLKQQYQIQHSNRAGKLRTTRSLEEAKQLMAELNGIHVVPLTELEPESPYSLRLKATLEKNTLPLGIHYILPFTSLWDFETDWRTVEFRY